VRTTPTARAITGIDVVPPRIRLPVDFAAELAGATALEVNDMVWLSLGFRHLCLEKGVVAERTAVFAMIPLAVRPGWPVSCYGDVVRSLNYSARQDSNADIAVSLVRDLLHHSDIGRRCRPAEFGKRARLCEQLVDRRLERRSLFLGLQEIAPARQFSGNLSDDAGASHKGFAGTFRCRIELHCVASFECEGFRQPLERGLRLNAALCRAFRSPAWPQ
jgi:hypothetical protein